MQLTESKLKKIIKEAVVESIQDNELMKVFVAECIKQTITGLYETTKHVDSKENVSHSQKQASKPIAESKRDRVNMSLTERINRNIQKMESRTPKKVVENHSDFEAAQLMFESEFSDIPENKLINEFQNEESIDTDDEEILKLIGVK